jgi:hypothetical protein
MIKNENYFSFYFGNVTIRPLVDCNLNKGLIRNNKKLCALEVSNIEYIPVGLKSEFESYEPLTKSLYCFIIIFDLILIYIFIFKIHVLVMF